MMTCWKALLVGIRYSPCSTSHLETTDVPIPVDESGGDIAASRVGIVVSRKPKREKIIHGLGGPRKLKGAT